MTRPRFGAEEQLRMLSRIADALDQTPLGVLALGSAAVILRTGPSGTVTKDLDLHVYPTDDILAFQDALEEAIVDRLEGRMAWEPDGASLTAHVPVMGKEMPVEIILGRENFIEPEVLEDAVRTAEEQDGVLVPSWEHIVSMKAEAWFDRSIHRKEKYLEDLWEIREILEETGDTLEREEVERLVGMRPERKHPGMTRIVIRVFGDLLS